MDGLYGLPRNRLLDVQTFTAGSTAAGADWQVWRKRPGTSGILIFALGTGGSGGNGRVGAAGAAGGGGGGGAGAQTVCHLSSLWLPEMLYIQVGNGPVKGQSGVASRVAIAPSSVANDTIVLANLGASGGNSASGAGGSGGTGGLTSAISACPLAGIGQFFSVAGQNGIIGGAAIAGGNRTQPVTGTPAMGGTGGGGLPAAGNGTVGGSVNAVGAFPLSPGGTAATSTTTPGGVGNNGFQPFPNLSYFYCGTGGGSTHATATGAGLQGGNGGDAYYGSGGGGGGASLTGGSSGDGGRGGDGIVQIVAY